MIAQMIRAVLFAIATVTTLVGVRVVTWQTGQTGNRDNPTNVQGVIARLSARARVRTHKSVGMISGL
jgi:hypothetical protein